MRRSISGRYSLQVVCYCDLEDKKHQLYADAEKTRPIFSYEVCVRDYPQPWFSYRFVARVNGVAMYEPKKWIYARVKELPTA